MTKPDRASEPSMDDILASIRRIIAEEPQPTTAASSVKPTVSPGPSRAPIPRAAPVADTRPASALGTAGQSSPHYRPSDRAMPTASKRGEFALDGPSTGRAEVAAGAPAAVPLQGTHSPVATGLSPQSHRPTGGARLGDALSALVTAKRSPSPGDDLLQELSDEPTTRLAQTASAQTASARTPVASAPMPSSPTGQAPLTAVSPRDATVPTPDGFDRLRSALEAKTGQASNTQMPNARADGAHTQAPSAGAPSPTGSRDRAAISEGERIERETMDRAERLARRAERLARQAQRDLALGMEKSAGPNGLPADQASPEIDSPAHATSSAERFDTSGVSSALDALAAGLATPASEAKTSSKPATVAPAPLPADVVDPGAPACVKPAEAPPSVAKTVAPARQPVSAVVTPAVVEPGIAVRSMAPAVTPAPPAKESSVDTAGTAMPRAPAPTRSSALSPTAGNAEKVPTTTTQLASATAAPTIPGGVRTLEDTVAEMLRPMLREWLDANMPRIVEKALKVELASTLPQLEAPEVELPRTLSVSERH